MDVTELADEQREQAARERGDVWHARRRAEFELVYRGEDDDDLPWLVGAELTWRGFADRLEHSQVA